MDVLLVLLSTQHWQVMSRSEVHTSGINLKTEMWYPVVAGLQYGPRRSGFACRGAMAALRSHSRGVPTYPSSRTVQAEAVHSTPHRPGLELPHPAPLSTNPRDFPGATKRATIACVSWHTSPKPMFGDKRAMTVAVFLIPNPRRHRRQLWRTLHGWGDLRRGRELRPVRR
jgi:hypothetical protein